MGGDLYELPKGWVWINLENCVEILDSQRIPVNADEREKRILGKSQSELYPYYGATGQVGWIDEYLFDDELILLGEDGAPFLELFKNKAYRIKQKSWVNNHAHVLKALESLALNTFICHYLNIVDYHNYVTGTTRLKLNQSLMKKIAIPLAPLPEQHRIVTKIEELFTELDAGVELLKKLKAKLKRYRQAVLKAAVEGNLTKEWREANQGKLEPASMLLERILKQRREKWEAEQLVKMKAQGKTPKDDSWKLKYKEPVAPDTSDLPELPNGWCWVNIEMIGDIIGGLTQNSKRENLPLKMPYLRVANVYAGKLQLDEIYHIGVQPSEIERVLLHKGDLLIVEGNGSIDQIGRVALWDGSISPCLHQNHLIKIRFQYIELAKYVILWLLSVGGRNQITRVASSTSGLHTLSLSKVAALTVPLPPMMEQIQIFEEVERLFSVIDQLEKTIDTNLKRAEKLRQSILKQAFEGKLVPQDSNDEPAEKLLERIKNEKAKQTTTKTKRKTQSKTQSSIQLELPL